MAKRKPRTAMSVELDPDAQRAVNHVAERTGLPKKLIVSRVLAWFVDQGEITQALVLGQIPESVEASAARIALELMARNAGGEGAEPGPLGVEVDEALGRSRPDRQQSSA